MIRIKILHVLNEINFSGAEVMLHHSAKYFLNEGYQLYALNTDKQLGPFAEILKKSGYEVFHLPFDINFYHFRQLNNLIKKYKFDIIHTHAESNSFWIELIARMNGIKCVRTIHSTFVFPPHVRFIRFMYRQIGRFFLNVQFVSISKTVQMNENRQFLNDSKLIPNWINREVFAPVKNMDEKKHLRESLNIPYNSFVIISVGSCDVVKNHIEIIKALKIVSITYKNILYLNIGDGPLKNFLVNKSKELGLEENVRFLGHRTNVRDFLVASDVFIMTSKYEGLGNALIEAESCELPAIVYNVSGLRELVFNGRNGFLIEENNQILAEKIMYLYENPEVARQMGIESGKFVKENYDISKSLQLLLNLYSQQCEKSSNKPLVSQD